MFVRMCITDMEHCVFNYIEILLSFNNLYRQTSFIDIENCAILIWKLYYNTQRKWTFPSNYNQT